MAEDFVATYGLDTRPFAKRLVDSKSLAEVANAEMVKGIKKTQEEFVKPFVNIQSMARLSGIAIGASVAIAAKGFSDLAEKNSYVNRQLMQTKEIGKDLFSAIGENVSLAINQFDVASIKLGDMYRKWSDMVQDTLNGGTYGEAAKARSALQEQGKQDQRMALLMDARSKRDAYSLQLFGMFNDPRAKFEADKLKANLELQERDRSLAKLRSTPGLSSVGDILAVLSQAIYNQAIVTANDQFSSVGVEKSKKEVARTIAAGMATDATISSAFGVDRRGKKDEQFQNITSKNFESALRLLNRIEKNTQENGASFQ